MPQYLLDAYITRISKKRKSSQSLSNEEEMLIYKASWLLTFQMVGKSETRFTSISITDPDLTEIAQKFVEHAGKVSGETEVFPAHVDHDVSRLLPYVRRLYESNNDSNRYKEQFHEGNGLNLLNPPRPKHFGSLPPTGFFWITEIDIESYRLPPRPEFGPLTICNEKPEYGSGQVRVTSDGFGFVCPNIVSGFGDLDRTLVDTKGSDCRTPVGLRAIVLYINYNQVRWIR